ncbi:hypothetical protein EROP_13050 [Erysipelotrichaceae bacterium OPF54]|uniref:hypothetical protein n=1 Tax=uncultured Dubosiella sp. TaxID=1937011 RepID=UPI00208A0419|nr:hypothetical protein [uncultured Dubosiella sp.]GJM57612.1 hypothetical protein EROP_13050 [Erysipelotrichaceae bacterium OPF54]
MSNMDDFLFGFLMAKKNEEARKQKEQQEKSTLCTQKKIYDWRENYIDEWYETDLDPDDYDTEEEYLEALEEAEEE